MRRDADFAQKNSITTKSSRELATNAKKLYPALSKSNHKTVEPINNTTPPEQFLHSNVSATATLTARNNNLIHAATKSPQLINLNKQQP